ncbi:hypothetical protein BH23BAC1_BH23BAC1_17810 [soil metagenome]
MKAVVAPKQTNEARSGSPAKPFFAKSAENSFFTDQQHVAPFFSGIQTKLAVGEPGDKYEQEADAMADQVMRMHDTRLSLLEQPEDEIQPKSILRLQPEDEYPLQKKFLQKKCEKCEKEDIQPKLLQRQPDDEDRIQMKLVQRKCDQCEKDEIQPKLLQRQPEDEDDVLQAKLKPDNTSSGMFVNISGQLNNSNGGDKIDNHTRQFMESRFDADFGDVRIHKDEAAVKMNQQLNAQAFANGRDVYFNQGKYNPGTSNGKHLLAHELTHTIQQGAVKLNPGTNSKPNDALVENNREVPLAKPGDGLNEPTSETPSVSELPSEPKQATVEPLPNQIDLASPAETNLPSAGENTQDLKDTEGASLPQADQEISAKEAESVPGQATGSAVTDTAIPKVSLQGQSSAGLLSQVAALSPVSFVQNAPQFTTAVPQIQTEEKNKLSDSFPQILAPTGLPVRERPTVPKVDLTGGAIPELGAEGAHEGGKIETEHAQPKGDQSIANIPTPKAQGEDDPNFIQNILASLSKLPVRDPSINTNAGTRPPVDVSGAANPVQNQQNQTVAGQDISQGLAQGQQASQQDFGQDNIYPYLESETIKPQTPPSPPPPYVGQELDTLPELPVEGYTYFNEQAQSQYQETIASQTSEYEAKRTAWEVASAEEKKQGEQRIETETVQAKAEQEAVQTQAQSEVTGYRQQWQEENEQLKTDFELQSSTRKGEIDQQITTEIQTTDLAVETELRQAEQKAETEKANTEREAQQKRDEAKNHKPGFWERAKNAIGDFFASIRNAINNLFNKLRRWVAELIERAKAAVNRLIDAARKKIIGWIESFGDFLKGLVNKALSAFPEIAERFNKLIDKGINWAVEKVNNIAENLKKITSSILDALGKALDLLLSGLQLALNAIINAFEKLAQFFLKILHELAEVIRKLINRWGGDRFRIDPDGTLVISIKDITLFENIEKQYPEEPQPIALFIPIVGGSGAIGPIPVAGALGIQLWGTLQGVLALGPGLIRSIEIRLNPFSSAYSGQGQLYIAAAVGPRLTFFGGPAGYGGAIIPITPPIFVALSLEAGLRATGTGWGIGALQTSVLLAYVKGDISFEMLNEIMLGILLQADLDFSAALRVYGDKGGGKALCKYIHPLKHWEWGKAHKIDIPLKAGRAGGKYYFDFGPVTGGPMPVEDIETAITPLDDAGFECMSWDEIYEYLCEIGIIPQTFCAEKDDHETKELPPSAASCSPVNPSGSPTVNKPGPDNTCTPSLSSTRLNWNVVSVDNDTWGVCVSALILAGIINIKPWPSKPNAITVPNTSNPEDGGNIEDKSGSKNHWQFAIDDMADYDSATGGGAGKYWHSTNASEAHEWAHWNKDYKSDSVMSKSGGNWPKVNSDLNTLRESKSSSPNAVDARKKLEPRVEILMSTWRGDTVKRWNKIIGTSDKPGNGGNGYAAGMQVLNGLIRKIRDYAKKKGWDKALGILLNPPGDCTEERHRELQDEVDRQCKKNKRACDSSQDCATLKSYKRRNEKCARARKKINKECFNGGDPGHRQAEKEAERAAKKCEEIYRNKC